jgi:hypothetical protein
MLFTFPIHLRDEHAPAASVILAIHGRLVDTDRAGALAVSLNYSDRRAWWTEEGLVLDQPVAIRFDAQTQRLLDRFAPDVLPDAATKVLEAISRAGAEAAVQRCDLCRAIFPAGQAVVHAICVCPSCDCSGRFSLDNKESIFGPPA